MGDGTGGPKVDNKKKKRTTENQVQFAVALILCNWVSTSPEACIYMQPEDGVCYHTAASLFGKEIIKGYAIVLDNELSAR